MPKLSKEKLSRLLEHCYRAEDMHRKSMALLEIAFVLDEGFANNKMVGVLLGNLTYLYTQSMLRLYDSSVPGLATACRAFEEASLELDRQTRLQQLVPLRQDYKDLGDLLRTIKNAVEAEHSAAVMASALDQDSRATG